MKITSREEYISEHAPLTLSGSPALPSTLFAAWYQAIAAAEPLTANITFLATLRAGKYPSVRAVLLREYAKDQYIFYTHYNSQKGRELTAHPYGALTFYWHRHSWQLRIEGKTERISAAASDAYFKSRPFDSQVVAASSHQSEVLEDPELFTQRIAKLSAEYQGREHELKRPSNWGGIAINATYYEFWRGQSSRRHERLSYRQTAPESWEKTLLYP